MSSPKHDTEEISILDKMKAYLTKERIKNAATFAVLLAIYALASIFVTAASRSQTTLLIGGKVLPVSALAGVCSALANMCMIFLVVFFGKVGLITALVVMIVQFPVFVRSLLFAPTLASLPGASLSLLTIIAIVLIYRRNVQIEKLRVAEVENLKEQQRLSQHLFEQTATALVNAIDAKDTYAHGHSGRVAGYSEKIARAMGKSDEECYKIYYTALLHDVGKLGIPDSIINKKGRLTPEEYDIIKTHPVVGEQILSGISEYPYLCIGAHYHHERYDGQGYPDRLKGEDIPEVARIIAVAEAYDAMSSSRGYRDAIPQQMVREEIVKNSGTQFDPEIAKIMQHLIDLDSEYEMKERDNVKELAGRDELYCSEYRNQISEGINISQYETKIHFKFWPKENLSSAESFPALILFDSLDGRVHATGSGSKDLAYFEYCEIFFDGFAENKGAREIRTDIFATERSRRSEDRTDTDNVFDVSAVKVDDHALIKIDDGSRCIKVTIALPDSSRYLYVGLTGKNCRLGGVRIRKASQPTPEENIPRLAPKMSYIDVPAGNVPNIQINGHRTASTDGILLTDRIKIDFHTMSLPTARLIWHCPFFVIFSSDDGKVYGPNYHEYAVVRLDGETWKEEEAVDNTVEVEKGDDFGGWELWKAKNKDGLEASVQFAKNGKRITTLTENLGLKVMNTTVLKDESVPVYVALSGDQVALTNIRVE